VIEEFIRSHEPIIRLAAFAGVFAAVALAEWRSPRRALALSRLRRWAANLGILAVDIVVLRLVFPAAAVGLAVLAAERGWGLFNNVGVPGWAALVLSVAALDFVIYLQHVMFHAVPVLWRLHRVHHADTDFDLTTGLRFHPIEIVLSMLIKFAAVVVLGPPALAVIVFEVLLNATAVFNHGNLRLPAAVDRVLRLLVVTPDMHRVHHSVHAHETNSNFGFSIPWWDRLFGTYQAQPDDGHVAMSIGLDRFREEKWSASLPALLVLPFVGGVGAYPINRREWTKDTD
jgi:sterol desaturase/sphingolipid hydroxylase (fatty acid hydroxylase superfamily)